MSDTYGSVENMERADRAKGSRGQGGGRPKGLQRAHTLIDLQAGAVNAPAAAPPFGSLLTSIYRPRASANGLANHTCHLKAPSGRITDYATVLGQ